MKIAFLNSGLQARGGADRWLLGVVAALRASRPDVETVLLYGREDPALPPHERHRLGPGRRVRGLERRGLRAAGGAGAVARLAAVLDEVDADVVHCNDVVDPGLLSVVAATGRGVATVQDHRFFCPGPGKVLPDSRPCSDPMGSACASCLPDAGYRERMLSLTRARLSALSAMAAVTVLSRYMQQELASAGVAATLTPPFVDHLPVRPPSAPRHHLFIGRLAEHKGIATAVAAGRRTRLPLVVAGAGPVPVAGARWVDRAELADLLSAAASVWMPGVWAEPFGIVGLEALAAGVPVIGTLRGGTGEWLEDERTGVIVPAGDVDALVRAADRLADDPTLRECLGRQGRAMVAARFSVQRSLAALWPVWEQVAGT
ncbi:MAG: glycosyltransferase [Deltaproteobacteria bacterium]|nr:MAG: glycosyltransferase [Deltaproteobacteria bacterium]